MIQKMRSITKTTGVAEDTANINAIMPVAVTQIQKVPQMFGIGIDMGLFHIHHLKNRQPLKDCLQKIMVISSGLFFTFLKIQNSKSNSGQKCCACKDDKWKKRSVISCFYRWSCFWRFFWCFCQFDRLSFILDIFMGSDLCFRFIL